MPYFIDEFGEGYKIEMRRGPKIENILSNLARKNERILQVAVREWMDFTQKQIRHDLVEKYQKSVASELTDWEYINNQGVTTIKPAALKIMQTGGNAAYKNLAIAGAFDVLNVQAVKAVNKFCSKLVVDVTENTKKGINVFVKHGIKEGYSMSKIARGMRPLVGLTGKQTQAVIHYRQLLQIRRPDLTAAQVDKSVMRYTNKTHRLRMENIARTETARAQNIGYCGGLEQVGVEEGELSVAPGACDECLALDKTRYPISEAAGVVPIHPRCRCAILPVVGEKAISHPLKKPPPGFPKEKPVVAPPKSVLSPKPADKKLFQAENTGKAESNAHRILGINRFSAKERARVSFTGMDVKAANQVNKALYTFKQKFPEMQLGKIEFGKDSADVFMRMTGTSKGGTLLLNEKYLSSKGMKKFERELARYNKTNYFVADNIEGLVYHELGHGLNYNHLYAKYQSKAMVAQEMKKLEGIRFKAKGLSKYGAQDGAEGVAESFTKYMQTGGIQGIELESGGSVASVLKTYAGLEL